MHKDNGTDIPETYRTSRTHVDTGAHAERERGKRKREDIYITKKRLHYGENICQKKSQPSKIKKKNRK